VPPRSVVEGFDVFEDLGRELAAGRPGLTVYEFFLERGEEALGDGVRVRLRLRLMAPLGSELFV
jgi:hypothetical protein